MESDMVRVELTKIMISDTMDQQIIVLKEKDGSRSFPIVIGIYEALAIDRGVKGRKTERPLTHDLLMSVIDSLSATLQRVVVNDLRNSTFYAKLVLRQNGRTIEVDSRPSDAIALAVQRDIPIFVAEKVLDAACDFDLA